MEKVKEAPTLMLIPIVVFALLAIIIGIYPKLVTDFLLPYFNASL
jgi:formate hydrogenlyase subunit 3/multisubunit Na+/H+ antiporter MnhD subunit